MARVTEMCHLPAQKLSGIKFDWHPYYYNWPISNYSNVFGVDMTRSAEMT